MTMDNQALADRLSARRARMLPVIVILFFIQQGVFYADAVGAARPVDQFKIGAWVVMSAVLLWVLATGGFALFRAAEVKQLMNDEGTQANRMAGIQLGFWCAMGAALVLFVASPWFALTPREAIHLIVTLGIAPAVLRFAMLERRALKP
jgi:hypothetical protein